MKHKALKKILAMFLTFSLVIANDVYKSEKV
jgi:hypothetical protein